LKASNIKAGDLNWVILKLMTVFVLLKYYKSLSNKILKSKYAFPNIRSYKKIFPEDGIQFPYAIKGLLDDGDIYLFSLADKFVSSDKFLITVSLNPKQIY
jgi:hypothetical protein